MSIRSEDKAEEPLSTTLATMAISIGGVVHHAIISWHAWQIAGAKDETVVRRAILVLLLSCMAWRPSIVLLLLLLTSSGWRATIIHGWFMPIRPLLRLLLTLIASRLVCIDWRT